MDGILDLQSQHFHRKPPETMSSIASFCEDLGIEEFDMYGDFLKGAYTINGLINVLMLWGAQGVISHSFTFLLLSNEGTNCVM
jgi:hypothetical protein